MTWRHIAGLCACIVALLCCGLSSKCGTEQMKDMKEVVLVIGAGIIGDANGVTKSRTAARVTGKQIVLERGSDEQ